MLQAFELEFRTIRGMSSFLTILKGKKSQIQIPIVLGRIRAARSHSYARISLVFALILRIENLL